MGIIEDQHRIDQYTVTVIVFFIVMLAPA